ncbi:MAG: hypothetical protein L3J47_10900, partial [Sulfurovum sp.]|nr:hypothetical protein [Sulfurovum sp.]
GWFNIIEPYVRGTQIKEITFGVLRGDLSVKKEVTLETNGMVQVIDRPEMERKMAEIAESKGVKIVTCRKVRISELKDPIVVDASGYPPQSDKEAGTVKRSAVALQSFVDLDLDDIRIYFLKETDGYLWLFPSVSGYAKLGLGFWKKPIPLRRTIEKFAEKNGITIKGWTSGCLGVGINRPLVRPLFGKMVILVGDSAGLVDPFFAEGMTKAIVSARVMAYCLRRGKDYEEEIVKLFRKHYVISYLLYHLRKISPTLTLALLKFLKFKKLKFKHEALANPTDTNLDFNWCSVGPSDSYVVSEERVWKIR